MLKLGDGSECGCQSEHLFHFSGGPCGKLYGRAKVELLNRSLNTR